jgi:hypothetical protein
MNLKEEIQTHIDSYYRWLNEKTQIKEINNQWVEITAPYLDRHNDYLQIYAKKENDNYLLTDDGYIIQDLISCGCSLEGTKRQGLLKITLAGLGVDIDDNRLIIRASSENFAMKKHDLVQAMLAVNDLFYLSSSHTSSLFFEDVCNWMDNTNIRYISKIKFSGKTGYDHMFDFILPKSKIFPERIVQTLSNPKRDAALLLVQKWLDTRDTRPADSKLFAFLNDSNQKISAGVIDALNKYDLTPVLWSERNKIQDTLAA